MSETDGNKSVGDLTLHEWTEFDGDTTVLKFPAGWIYQIRVDARTCTGICDIAMPKGTIVNAMRTDAKKIFIEVDPKQSSGGEIAYSTKEV